MVRIKNKLVLKSELSNNAMCGLAGVCVVMVSSNSSAGVPMPKCKEIKLENFAIQFHSNIQKIKKKMSQLLCLHNKKHKHHYHIEGVCHTYLQP